MGPSKDSCYSQSLIMRREDHLTSKLCKNKLHPMTEENTLVDPKTGWRKCRTCRSESNKRDRAKHGDQRRQTTRDWRKTHQARSRELGKKNYDKIRAFINEAKQAPCMDCHQTFPPCVMDFDHRDPTEKAMNVGACRSLKKTIAEIEKCDLVCANCHRIRTWGSGRDQS